MKAFKAAGALALLALAFPAAAMAHHGSASVSCTGADYRFEAFQPGLNTVHYQVTVDDVPVAQGDYALNESGGRAGSVHVPLTVYGSHTVKAYAWWGPAGTAHGEVRPMGSPPMDVAQVSCMEAPPVSASAPVAPAAAPAPASAVKGVTAASPARVARLSIPSRCATRVARVTVAGRSMRRVTFSVNGRRSKTVTVRSGRRSITASLPLRRTGRPTQAITARVSFSNGARARTLTTRAVRCAQAQVQPQFTG